MILFKKNINEIQEREQEKKKDFQVQAEDERQ